MFSRARHNKNSAAPRGVSLLNSYRMREARRLVEEGSYPAQHLWGTWGLSSQWKTAVTNLCMNRLAERHALIRPLVQQVERFLGDPIQALWALLGTNRGNLVYAANPKTGTLIGILKHFRMVKIPYVVLVHSYPISSWAKWNIQAADALVVFSAAIKDQLTADGFMDEKITVAHWGPDRDWMGYRTRGEVTVDFASAGKTNRDYSALRLLASDGSLDGHILDGQDATRYREGQAFVAEGRPSYPEVMSLMSSARVVCIPLQNPAMLSGLTEVSDAIALGKPLVMTQNAWMPIDIESLGIGIWLRDSSPDTLLKAVKDAALIPSERILEVAGWFNMRSFSDSLESVFECAWARAGE